MTTEPSPAPARRAPAGAAVLREDVTEAIRAAVVEELAAVGFARMSIEGIARRAGVGKTAVYRRWKSKLHLVLDLVGAFAADGLPVPATGSLYGDLRALLEVMSHVLRHPVASAVIPDLLVEAARNPEIADAVRGALLDGQRRLAEGIVAEAVERGNCPGRPARSGHWTWRSGRCTGGRWSCATPCRPAISTTWRARSWRGCGPASRTRQNA